MKKIFCLGIFLLSSYWHCAFAQTNTSANPNFIIILADDLGYGDLSMNGSKQITTPHIDALASTGTYFSQAYVSSAVCSPSRAGLITGKNQVEFGYDNNLTARTAKGFDPEYAGLPVDQKTIATRLRERGYVTGIVGKWHLGYQRQFHPVNRGFDEYWGYIAGGHDYFSSKQGNKDYLAPIESNYTNPKPITYLTDDKGDECVDFIKRHSKEPFFFFASFNAPHTPLQALEEDLKLFKHITDKKRRTYAAMIYRLDLNVGKIMSALKEQGIDRNTLVVFLSDNGGPVNANASCNAPFRGQKGILFEGGIHVPMIMNWPDRIPAGQVYRQPVTALDIAATFYEIAGGTVSQPEFTGVNLLPFITSGNTGIPHESLKWKFTISRSIREGDWKLISVPDRMPMLYHLPSDASEQKDVSLQYMDITKKLLKKLGDWDVELPHSIILEGPQWKRKQLDLYDDAYQLEQPGIDN